jgi:hypothetical protein
MAKTLAKIVAVLKPKRRWFQFSLMQLLLAVLIAGSCLGLLTAKINNKRRERCAVAAIQELNGVVTYSKTSGGIPPGPAWLRAILGDDACAEVESVFFCEPLYLPHPWLTDDDLVHLRPLKGLRRLRLWGQFTDAGLACLAGMNDLEVLVLEDVQLTDAGVANMQALRQLTVLNSLRSKISDIGLENLGHLTALEAIRLEGSRISDSGLIHLRSLPALRELDLSETSITDAGLDHLKELNGLTHLRLDNTQVSHQGMAKLRKALPNCAVTTGVYLPRLSF